MPDPVRVFMSHHHSPGEDAFTARLVADLKAAGADVWVDDEGITSDDFVRKINEGLAGRQWLVLVMTPDALKSDWVQREVNAALAEQTAGRMLGVIPIVMTACNVTDIPILWRNLHRYDATQGYGPAHDRLLTVMGLPLPQRHQQEPIPRREEHTSELRTTIHQRLASLDFVGKMVLVDGTLIEYIVPPLCSVPEGSFLMGEDKCSVTLPRYQVARYPVTVAEYADFVQAGHDAPRN